MLAKQSLFQHEDEAIHDRGIGIGNILLWIEVGMEIEKIEDQHLDGSDKHVLVEMVATLSEAEGDLLEIVGAQRLLLWREVHDGVQKQGEAPFRAIIALRSTQRDKIGRYIDHLYPEVLLRLDALHQHTFAHDHQISRPEDKRLAIENKPTVSCRAVGVRQVICVGLCSQSIQGLFDEDILHVLLLLSLGEYRAFFQLSKEENL